MIHGRIVVVGGSLAGVRAAEAARDWGFEGELVLVADEEAEPYARPPLSKEVLRGAQSAQAIALRSPADYEDLEITWRRGIAAAALDVTGRTVTLADGEVLAYDGLVIATGASPLNPFAGCGLAGVHVLRTLDDCLALRGELEHRPRLAVIGAGFIGAEVAASCREQGLEVTLIDALPTPLSRVLGPEVGEAVAELHRGHGVDLRCGLPVVKIDGTDRVERVVLDDGSVVAADLVVVGLGVTPNTGWLATSGLSLDNGVLCDAHCRASAPGVVAAGDVARWYHELFDAHVRVEHWTNALAQGAAAMRSLVDPADAPVFAPVPYFWSQQFDVEIKFWGHAQPGDQVRIVRGATLAGGGVAVYERQGRLMAALAFGQSEVLRTCRDLIKARSGIDDAISSIESDTVSDRV